MQPFITWLPLIAGMVTPDPLSRWLLSQLHPAVLDTVPGIDQGPVPGTLPDPFPGAPPKPDPDPLPPAKPGTAGIDPGFPVEPVPTPSQAA
jgi:hypothetical protein